MCVLPRAGGSAGGGGGVLTWEADGDDEDEAGVPQTAGLRDVERGGHSGGVNEVDDVE